MFNTSSSGSTWISRMRTTASEFCSVLHRRLSDDSFISPFTHSYGRFGSGLGVQPGVGLLSIGNSRSHSHNSHPYAGARSVLMEVGMSSPASIHKHPIHPMLIVFPIALWIFSLI